jgi:hypothetical protein
MKRTLYLLAFLLLFLVGFWLGRKSLLREAKQSGYKHSPAIPPPAAELRAVIEARQKLQKSNQFWADLFALLDAVDALAASSPSGTLPVPDFGFPGQGGFVVDSPVSDGIRLGLKMAATEADKMGADAVGAHLRDLAK